MVNMRVVVISFLICIGCLFSNTTTFASATSDVIVVDNEGDGDFTSIKDALASASPGDTIEVYSGTYYEYEIWINVNNIILQGIPNELGAGNDTGKPFINGEGLSYIFTFNKSDITLDGFHIENKDGTQHDIIDVTENADRSIISNNDLSNTSICFIYVKSSDNKIINNTISHSRNGIVLREPSNNNIVRGNEISDCTYGILVWGGENNLIEGNTVKNCDKIGIDIAGDDNTIQYNTVQNNPLGIYLRRPGNTISNNNFINNDVHAIGTHGKFIWMISNRWNGNYWGKGRILPYPILSSVFIFPCLQFDWRPAQEPYDISGLS